jgi:hypothetical protein
MGRTGNAEGRKIMWEEAIRIASGSGVFAVLFVVLLYWVLSTNNDREKRFISVVETQAKALQKIDKIDAVEADVRDIRHDIKSLLDRRS